MRRCGLLVLLAITGGAHAQLRPKRVGTNALGEQQMAQGGGDMAGGGGDMAANLEAMAAAFGGGDDAGGFDAEAMLKNLDPTNNPLLKGIADANPELAKLMSDPSAMKEQMAQMAKLMQSGEGQEFAQKMMSEMQSVLTYVPLLAGAAPACFGIPRCCQRRAHAARAGSLRSPSHRHVHGSHRPPPIR